MGLRTEATLQGEGWRPQRLILSMTDSKREGQQCHQACSMHRTETRKQGDGVSRSSRVSRPTLHGAVQVCQQVGRRARHAGLPGLEGRVVTNVPKILAC